MSISWKQVDVNQLTPDEAFLYSEYRRALQSDNRRSIRYSRHALSSALERRLRNNGRLTNGEHVTVNATALSSNILLIGFVKFETISFYDLGDPDGNEDEDEIGLEL